MKSPKPSALFLGLLMSTIAFTACDKDDDPVTPTPAVSPINVGSSVTVTNTFQSTAFTNDVETDIETLFMVPAGSLAATANVGNGVEFPSYLLNLYDIDIDANGISFEVVAQANDSTYGSLFRILEPDTYDRYYLSFDNAQNVNSWTTSDPTVNLRKDSEQVLVVEIGEGFDFQPGASFSISLTN